jgi:hypothetical protein
MLLLSPPELSPPEPELTAALPHRIASSRQGGALYNYQGNVAVMGSTTFVNNTADSQVGGYPTFRSARADSYVCRLVAVSICRTGQRRLQQRRHC